MNPAPQQMRQEGNLPSCDKNTVLRPVDGYCGMEAGLDESEPGMASGSSR